MPLYAYRTSSTEFTRHRSTGTRHLENFIESCVGFEMGMESCSCFILYGNSVMGFACPVITFVAEEVKCDIHQA